MDRMHCLDRMRIQRCPCSPARPKTAAALHKNSLRMKNSLLKQDRRKHIWIQIDRTVLIMMAHSLTNCFMKAGLRMQSQIHRQPERRRNPKIRRNPEQYQKPGRYRNHGKHRKEQGRNMNRAPDSRHLLRNSRLMGARSMRTRTFRTIVLTMPAHPDMSTILDAAVIPAMSTILDAVVIPVTATPGTTVTPGMEAIPAADHDSRRDRNIISRSCH